MALTDSTIAPPAKPAGKGHAEVSASVVYRANGLRMAGHPEVTEVDFRNPTFLAEGELRRLRNLQQEFVRALSSRISAFLRSEVAMTIAKFSTQSYESFMETLKSPTHLSLFRVTPLNGVGLLEIPPRMGIALTNRLLGGRAHPTDQDLHLTEIEIALLEDVIAIITDEWCHQWKDELKLEASLLAHESHPRFVQACPNGATMLILSIDVMFGDFAGIIQIAVPVLMIDPILKRMQASRSREGKTEGSEQLPNWRGSYDGISIGIHAELHAAEMTIADVLQLKPGDTLELPVDALQRTRICVSNVVRFIGRAGQKDGRVAVEIDEKINPTNL